ncbi:MAG: hypothetical protein U0S49_12290 [Rhodospirillales bacterium]|nr:hypothetical protein [Rhodospirillales bacterium]
MSFWYGVILYEAILIASTVSVTLLSARFAWLGRRDRRRAAERAG